MTFKSRWRVGGSCMALSCEWKVVSKPSKFDHNNEGFVSDINHWTHERYQGGFQKPALFSIPTGATDFTRSYSGMASQRRGVVYPPGIHGSRRMLCSAWRGSILFSRTIAGNHEWVWYASQRDAPLGSYCCVSPLRTVARVCYADSRPTPSSAWRATALFTPRVKGTL